jgi:hypothetical protein
MRSIRTAALAVLTLSAALSAASSFAGGHAIPEACQGDAASLCAGMAPGDGKFGKCMKANRDKVSEGCKSAVKAAREQRGARHAGKAASGAAPGAGPAFDEE